MLKTLVRRFAWSTVILFLLPLTTLQSQEERGIAKKREFVDLQLQVTDSTTGNAVDHATVEVKWSDGEASAVTDWKGVAKVKALKGKNSLRVIADGYVPKATTADVAKENPPIKITLDKQKN